MGAWGPSSFENDAAADWVADFRASGPTAMWKALESVARGDENPDADSASAAIAAADAVALAVGARSADGMDAELVNLFRMSSDDVLGEHELVGLAHFTVNMLRESSSELQELWNEAEDGAAWKTSVDDLWDRLTVIASRHGFHSPGSVADLPVRKERSLVKPGKRKPEQKMMDMMEDIRIAIGGLRFDLEMVRMDLQDGLAELRDRQELGVTKS